RVAAVAAPRDAWLERTVSLFHEDDATVRFHELEEREEDLLEQPVEVALEANVSAELPRDAKPLVVDAKLLRVMSDLLIGEEAFRERGDLCADRARRVEHVDA